MHFEIDDSYICDISIVEEWGMYDNLKVEELTPDQLIKILKGKDRCRAISNKDHPEFAKLREQLGQDGYIKIERSWWNGDMVTKPFTLNGKNFEIGTKFPCGAAMKSHLKYIKNTD